jgi:AcrR family transcriptional regulator
MKSARPSAKLSAQATATPGHMTDTSKLRQRTGGRLDRSRDPAILNAALAAVAERGYNDTNMNDIAARAGVGKATIYRRWSSKAALVTDALIYWRPEMREMAAPNTGSLSGDLEYIVEQVARNDNDLISNDLLFRVALEAVHDPKLASALDDLLVFKGVRAVSTILAQAAERGEIAANRDLSLVADVLAAVSLLRVIGGQVIDASFIRRVIDTLVLPALGL